MAEKLKPIEIEGSKDEVEKTINDLIDKCHTVFKTALSKDSKPPLGDREIFIPFTWIDNKAEIFWHIASLETQTNLSIKPCNNEISSYYCDSNCVSGMMKIMLNNGEERSKCIYRAVRVGWIKAIIMMFNENDKRVKYWEKVHSNGRNRIYLRYQEEENDYIGYLIDESGKSPSLTKVVKNFVKLFDSKSENKLFQQIYYMNYLESQLLSHANGYLWFANSGAWNDIRGMWNGANNGLLLIMDGILQQLKSSSKSNDSRQFKSLINLTRNGRKRLYDIMKEASELFALPAQSINNLS